MGDKTAVMRIVPSNTGFMFEKVGQRDVNFDWVEWGESGALWMRLAIPYRKNAGPGGNFYIVGFVTPVDEQNCRVFFWRCRKVEGWQRDVWRFLYRTRLEGLHWDVLEQDRVVLESDGGRRARARIPLSARHRPVARAPPRCGTRPRRRSQALRPRANDEVAAQ